MHRSPYFCFTLLSFVFTACFPERVEPEPEPEPTPTPMPSAQEGEVCNENIRCVQTLECLDGICTDTTTTPPQVTDAGGHSDGTLFLDAGQDLDAGGSGDGSTDGSPSTDAGPALDAGGSNEPVFCLANEYVNNQMCTACPEGSTNAAGDDASGNDTTCDATLCEADHYVLNHVCTPCSFNTTNAANDDASGEDTLCDPPADCAGFGGGDNLLYCDGSCLPPSSTVISCGKTWQSPTCGSIDIFNAEQGGVDNITLAQIQILRQRFDTYLLSLYNAPSETLKNNAVAAFDALNIQFDNAGPVNSQAITHDQIDDIADLLLPLARYAFYYSDADVADKAITWIRWFLRATAFETCDDFGLTGAFYDLDQMHEAILMLHPFIHKQKKRKSLPRFPGN